MPGWYIHMEAAKQAADRLRAGQLPPDFPRGVDAHQLGDIAHKWRNYLALGAIGPDIAVLFPDFKPPVGSFVANTVDWYIRTWDVLDAALIEPWEKYAEPALTGFGEVLDDFTGETLHEVGEAMQTVAATLKDGLADVLANVQDWFGLLQSGVPQGIEENAYTWLDMFHYRRTYEFARTLFQNAKTEQHKAFALGWMSHCATDVTGHAFVNAKCGGPYRLHWQRHHLIENHMDALVYDSQHHGTEPYGELDTAALHFRLAFRKRNDAPYNGAEDAPAYDYFDGQAGPNYDSADTPLANRSRDELWDLDTGDMPEDLCNFIIETMRQVYGVDDHVDSPQILTDVEGDFHDGNSGRPNTKVLQDTFFALYHYMKLSSTGGYSPRRPLPPSIFGDHTPPFPPGFETGVEEDPTRGADLDAEDDFTIIDLLALIIGLVVYIAALALWLVTLVEADIAALLTYPARQLLYEYVVVPLYSLYMAVRQPLILTGFLQPKPEEISVGLVKLGARAQGPNTSLREALSQPTQASYNPANVDLSEPSGRVSHTAPFGADPAYPRQIIKDTNDLIRQALNYLSDQPSCDDETRPSEYLRPWLYPDTNNADERNGWEAALSHPGPFVRGQDATVLMGQAPGSPAARRDLELATNPAQSEQAADQHLRKDEHLGDAVDYSVYLMGRLAHGDQLPDFNLDADRGYGYHTWEWDRDPAKPITPNFSFTFLPSPPPSDPHKYDFNQPCTVPEGYCQPAESDSGPQYNPNVHLAIHYGEAAPDRCETAVPVSPAEISQAGMNPDGSRRR